MARLLRLYLTEIIYFICLFLFSVASAESFYNLASTMTLSSLFKIFNLHYLDVAKIP